MRFLVIGLGSMGKRRIRNLQALGFNKIAGFDLRTDRREEVKKTYKIQTYKDFQNAQSGFCPNVFIISTSPESHMKYAFTALELKIPCFVEASVVEKEKIKLLDELSQEKKIFFAPSCTMKYFQGPIEVRKLLANDMIGRPLFFHYHTGQSLEEWHPWEKPKEYYVSRRETGAAREIVPFELTWICDIFGRPEILNAYRLKLSKVDADIDDIYSFTANFQNYNGVTGNLTMEVISSYQAVRRLHIVGEGGQIIFDGNLKEVKYTSRHNREWKVIDLEEGDIKSGYINPENPYILEMKDFITSVRLQDPGKFPNSLKKDYQILTYLDQVEKLCLP